MTRPVTWEWFCVEFMCDKAQKRTLSQMEAVTLLNYLWNQNQTPLYRIILSHSRSYLCRATVAQSEATRVVNLCDVSSNLSSASNLPDVWQKSLWQGSFVFHQWTNSLCGKQPVAWKECCVEYWCEKARKHMSTGHRHMTEFFLKKC